MSVSELNSYITAFFKQISRLWAVRSPIAGFSFADIATMFIAVSIIWGIISFIFNLASRIFYIPLKNSALNSIDRKRYERKEKIGFKVD